jgi:uncharacterized membrane protein
MNRCRKKSCLRRRPCDDVPVGLNRRIRYEFEISFIRGGPAYWRKPDWRLWSAAAVSVMEAMILGIAGQSRLPRAGGAPATFADVKQILDQRCHGCHGASPQFPSMSKAPKGVMFDTPEQIRRFAPQILAQTVTTRTMPLGNITEIIDAERSILGTWIVAGSRLN